MSADRLEPGWVIYCDTPDCESGFFADRQDVQSAYNAAEARGWGTRGDRDACPLHLAHGDGATACTCCGDEPATNGEYCEGCVEFLWEGSDA